LNHAVLLVRRNHATMNTFIMAAHRDGRRTAAANGMRGLLEGLHRGVKVRDARPEEFAAIGDLRVAAYRADGFLSATSTYAPVLRALGTDGTGEILAAVDAGRVLGTVMLLPWPGGGNILRGPGEAEIRALAVDKDARGRGIGRTLVAAVTQRAAARDVRLLLLLTAPGMRAAQHLYAEAGFCRLPDRDWQPGSGLKLLAFSKILGAG
jgi:ribosomal protein S18 acetylase RimI-like enzyme